MSHTYRDPFFFVVKTEGEDCVFADVWYLGYDAPAPSQRSVAERIRESFIKEDFFDLFDLDKTKNWQVAGSATVYAWYDYGGERHERIDIDRFEKSEISWDFDLVKDESRK